MAPSAVDANAPGAVELEKISMPPTGVVLPPKDIRSILEKTAGYVARNGAVFEDRIREKEKHDPRFSFLSANDAYHAFYQWRLSEIRSGRGTLISAGRAGEAASTIVEPAKPAGPPEPPEFRFSARMPNIDGGDLDIVRVTALFVAKNGRSFLTTLSQRENRNFQFDFLRPNHSLHQFFLRLVDQYTELLRSGPPESSASKAEQLRIQELQHNLSDKFHVLTRAKGRAEWAKYQNAQKVAKEEAEEQEKLNYAQIDWHDFVVVETVLFTPADDGADLPPPTTLNDLQSASLEQKAAMSLQPANMRIEEGFPSFDDIPYYPPAQTQQHSISPQPPPQTYATPTTPAFSPPMPTPHQDTFMRTNEDDEETRLIAERTAQRNAAQAAQADAKGNSLPMKIRTDYVPRAAAQAASRRAPQTVLCPNCKQQIAVNEYESHARIELLDPRWKNQNSLAQSRALSTNLATASAVSNLKRLASSRSDLFDGATGAPVTEEEMERRKRAALNSYDGQAAGRAQGHGNQGQGQQGKTIQEQIKSIHEKAKR
ncbi:MAG: SF3a splicing factor complex subunit [Vezdaea acicularis]|nr:MAG: SF3a splicing factor complex subunit [Vezdaea acicularis]